MKDNTNNLEKFEFHKYSTMLVGAKKRIEESKKLSQFNKNLLLKKYYVSRVNDGLAISSIIRDLIRARTILELLDKDFILKKLKTQDIELLLSKFQKKDTWNTTTINEHKISLRQLLKFINGGDEYPNIAKVIRFKQKKRSKKVPSQLITEDDVLKITNVCNNLRDQAFINLLFDSGCRISELGNLKIKDFDIEEGKISVYGKTGGRKPDIFTSIPFIKRYLKTHLNKDNKESFFFLRIDNEGKGRPASYSTLAKVLRVAMLKAKIDKPNNPHLWRHSLATLLAANGATNHHLCQQFGWTDPKTAQIYINMSAKQQRDGIRKARGLESKEEQKQVISVLTPKVCEICNHSNSPNETECENCHNPLSLKDAILRNKKHSLAKEILEAQDIEKFSELMETWRKKEKEKDLNKIKGGINNE